MKKLTPKERKRIVDFAVRATLVFVCVVVIILINSNGDDTPNEQTTTTGINANIPDPSKSDIIEDKLRAEPPQKEEKPEIIERIKMSMSTTIESHKEPTISNPEVAKVEVQQNLKQFYNRPKVDHEKERMQREIDELKSRINHEPQEVTIDEQITLIERSYEIAAKYQPTSNPIEVEPRRSPPKEKSQSCSVESTQSEIVSSLSTMSSRGFNTAVGETLRGDRNTFAACIDRDQTVTGSGTIRLRLLERITIGGRHLEKGSILTGVGKISGERLSIAITSIESGGMILPVKLTVIDSDGQRGIYVPNSAEVSAIKEIAANMGNTVGSAISFSSKSAGGEILSNLGTGAIQGVSEYAKDKAQEVRVHLKSGYKIMLYEEK